MLPVEWFKAFHFFGERVVKHAGQFGREMIVWRMCENIRLKPQVDPMGNRVGPLVDPGLDPRQIVATDQSK